MINLGNLYKASHKTPGIPQTLGFRCFFFVNQTAKIFYTLKDVHIMLYNNIVIILWILWSGMAWVDVIFFLFRQILSAKRIKNINYAI